MTSFYLVLALVLAITINNRFAGVRALGTLIAAVALGFMAWSIVLAQTDGTFAAAPPASLYPWALRVEGIAITLAALLLLWTLPRQLRSATTPLPRHSTKAAYGQITRGLHWASATLIIAAFTMGQFIAILAADNPVRADFRATHMAIGGAIFLLTFARMFERLVRPSPPTPGVAKAGHFLLYALITAICVTGLALAPVPVDLLGVKLPNLPAGAMAAPLHRVLAALIAVLFLAHLYAAFTAIRRMAR